MMEADQNRKIKPLFRYTAKERLANRQIHFPNLNAQSSIGKGSLNFKLYYMHSLMNLTKDLNQLLKHQRYQINHCNGKKKKLLYITSISVI